MNTSYLVKDKEGDKVVRMILINAAFKFCQYALYLLFVSFWSQVASAIESMSAPVWEVCVSVSAVSDGRWCKRIVCRYVRLHVHAHMHASRASRMYMCRSTVALPSTSTSKSASTVRVTISVSVLSLCLPLSLTLKLYCPMSSSMPISRDG